MNINKILVCDDHAFSRKGLIDYIKVYFNNPIEIIEAETGTEAIDLFKQHVPHFVFLDVEMPEINGIIVCEKIKHSHPETIIIFVTMHTEETIFTAIKQAQANGYISKSDTDSELQKCLDYISKKKGFYSSNIDSFENEELYLEYDRLHNKLNLLTNSEQKVVQLILEGKTSEEMLDILFITLRSLHNYRSRICKKLELPPRNNSLNHWLFINKESLKIFFTT